MRIIRFGGLPPPLMRLLKRDNALQTHRVASHFHEFNSLQEVLAVPLVLLNRLYQEVINICIRIDCDIRFILPTYRCYSPLCVCSFVQIRRNYETNDCYDSRYTDVETFHFTLKNMYSNENVENKSNDVLGICRYI